MAINQAEIDRISSGLLAEASGDDCERLITNTEITALYVTVKAEFRAIVKRAERVSMGSAGIPSLGNRMFWASVLFTRLVVISKSIEKLLPNPKPREHWDFSSVASLARNLSEAYINYFWLCEDEILDEVRDGRFILLYLHDYGSRKRLFPDNFSGSDDVYADLVSRFDSNVYLKTFTDSQRRVALKGEKTPFLQDEILERMGVDLGDFRTMYRFFSQHTHTGPLSFYRMVDHDRGTGVETRQEKIYMAIAVGQAAEALSRATEGHLTIFPDAEVRAPHSTHRDIVLNVERNQGRLRAGR